MKYCFYCFLFFLSFSCKHVQSKLGIDVSRQELKDALTEKPLKPVNVEYLISNEQTAIDIAEPILFSAYGKDQIIDERPYEVYLVDGYWVLNGTIPSKYEFGSTFLIILSAKDGRVIKLTHGK
jgi:hypothetical protein